MRNDDQAPFTEAKIFIDSVRETHSASKKSYTGKFAISANAANNIQAATIHTVSLSTSFNDASNINALENLLTRFEKLAGQNKFIISDNLRPYIAYILHQEMLENAQSLKFNNLIDVVKHTNHFGTEFIQNWQNEFPDFKATPSIIKRAITSYSANPRSFLLGVLKTIDEISTEEEFKIFHDTPSVIQRAATGHTTNPRDFLRKIINTIDEISKEEEFEIFHDTMGVIRHAAIKYREPRVFLRNAIRKMDEILTEEEFEIFHDSPRIIRRAIMGYSQNPKGFLRKAISVIDEISHGEEFEIFHDSPRMIKYIAANYPADPMGHLRNLITTFNEILNEEEFELFHDKLYLLKEESINHKDLRSFLRKIINGEDARYNEYGQRRDRILNLKSAETPMSEFKYH